MTGHFASTDDSHGWQERATEPARERAEPAAQPNRGAQRWALGVLWGVTLVSVASFATFGLRPHLLGSVPAGGAAYAWAYRILPVGQVLVAFGALVVLLRSARCRQCGWIFAVVYAVSLGSELLGTSTGLPFGDYSYGSSLGPRWFGLVPLVIPLSWFYMALPTYLLVRRLVGRGRAWITIVGAAALLSAWDLALDPAMSYVTPMWQWGESGAYYGMPWLNLVGWFVTGLVLMVLLRAWDVDYWGRHLRTGHLISFVAANVLLPLGMSAAAGLWGAVAATTAAYLAISLVLATTGDRASRGFAGRVSTLRRPANPTAAL